MRESSSRLVSVRCRWARRTAFKMGALLLILHAGLSASTHDVHAAEPACKLAILGDSLTAGFGVPVADALPQKLGAALAQEGIACTLIDAGVSGDTSAGGLSRLAWVLGDQPTHLVLELGGNDGLRALPVEQMEHNLDQIIAQAQAAQVKVFLAGIVAPPNLGRDYADAFKAVFPRLAHRYDIPFYPFLLDGIITDPKLMQADRIHPNAAGVDAMVHKILPSIVSWLRATGVASAAH